MWSAGSGTSTRCRSNRRSPIITRRRFKCKTPWVVYFVKLKHIFTIDRRTTFKIPIYVCKYVRLIINHATFVATSETVEGIYIYIYTKSVKNTEERATGGPTRKNRPSRFPVSIDDRFPMPVFLRGFRPSRLFVVDQLVRFVPFLVVVPSHQVTTVRHVPPLTKYKFDWKPGQWLGARIYYSPESLLPFRFDEHPVTDAHQDQEQRTQQEQHDRHDGHQGSGRELLMTCGGR